MWSCSYLTFSLHFSYHLLFSHIKAFVSDKEISDCTDAFWIFANALTDPVARFWYLQTFQYLETSDVYMLAFQQFMAKLSAMERVSEEIFLKAMTARTTLTGLPFDRVQPFFLDIANRADGVVEFPFPGEIRHEDISVQLSSVTDTNPDSSISAPSDEGRDPAIMARSPSASQD